MLHQYSDVSVNIRHRTCVDHPHHIAPRLKKKWSSSSTPLWDFVACSRVNFTFTFIREVEHPHTSPAHHGRIKHTKVQAMKDGLSSWMYEFSKKPCMKYWVKPQVRWITNRSRHACLRACRQLRHLTHPISAVLCSSLVTLFYSVHTPIRDKT